MRTIPIKLRKQIAADRFMSRCCYPNCGETKVEWDHVLKYAGSQINEAFAIIPACVYHHRGGGLNREYTEWIALSRATDEDLAKYPKTDWKQKKLYLQKKYGTYADKERT